MKEAKIKQKLCAFCLKPLGEFIANRREYHGSVAEKGSCANLKNIQNKKVSYPKWVKANRKRMVINSTRYNQNHREEFLKRGAEYREKNREKLRAYARQRRKHEGE